MLAALVSCSPFGALYPAPLARPFFKGLLAGGSPTYVAYCCVDPPCAYGVPPSLGNAIKETLIKSQSQILQEFLYIASS